MAVTWPLTNQWTDGYLLTAVDMQARITDPLNALYNLVAGHNYFEEFGPPTTAQVVAASTITQVTGWASVRSTSDYPAGAMASDGTWTAPDDGVYTFTYAVSWTTWTAGSRIALWFRRVISGTTQELYQAEDGSSTNGIYSIAPTFYVPKGGLVRSMVFQASGASRTLRNTIQSLSIYRNP